MLTAKEKKHSMHVLELFFSQSFESIAKPNGEIVFFSHSFLMASACYDAVLKTQFFNGWILLRSLIF